MLFRLLCIVCSDMVLTAVKSDKGKTVDFCKAIV